MQPLNRLAGAVAAGAVLAAVFAADPCTDRPRRGDIEGEGRGQAVKPEQLDIAAPPTFTYPKEPESVVIRDRSRINPVFVLCIDAGVLAPQVAANAADCVVADTAWLLARPVLFARR